MPVSNHAEYMRQWRARRAAARPKEVAPIRPPEEAPQAARRVPSTAGRKAAPGALGMDGTVPETRPRKVAPAVGGYQARPEDGWVARMTSKEQQAILARMAGEPRSRGGSR